MTLSSEFTYRTASPADQEAISVLDAWAFPNDLSPATISAQPFPLDFERTGLVVRRGAGLDGERTVLGEQLALGEQTVGGEQPVLGRHIVGEQPVLGRQVVGEQIVGAHSSYEFNQYPVPGAEIPVSGLTWVGVHPQFRRRGILRAMIEQHFADCVARGESVSALFAAEPTIYGRFGCGPASRDLRVTIPRAAKLKITPG